MWLKNVEHSIALFHASQSTFKIYWNWLWGSRFRRPLLPTAPMLHMCYLQEADRWRGLPHLLSSEEIVSRVAFTQQCHMGTKWRLLYRRCTWQLYHHNIGSSYWLPLWRAPKWQKNGESMCPLNNLCVFQVLIHGPIFFRVYMIFPRWRLKMHIVVEHSSILLIWHGYANVFDNFFMHYSSQDWGTNKFQPDQSVDRPIWPTTTKHLGVDKFYKCIQRLQCKFLFATISRPYLRSISLLFSGQWDSFSRDKTTVVEDDDSSPPSRAKFNNVGALFHISCFLSMTLRQRHHFICFLNLSTFQDNFLKLTIFTYLNS